MVPLFWFAEAGRADELAAADSGVRLFRHGACVRVHSG
jgi:hypothetical protein